MKNNKKIYMVPMVEIMNARVEKGFQASSGSTNPENNLNILPPKIEGTDLNLSDFD